MYCHVCYCVCVVHQPTAHAQTEPVPATLGWLEWSSSNRRTNNNNNLREPCQRRTTKRRQISHCGFSELNYRCLIDFQSHPDGEYKFIMVYQDHNTMFVVLRALKTKRAQEVAWQLVEIFALPDARMILEYKQNCREFSNNVVSSLKEYWPTFKIVDGKPRNIQS